MDLDPQQRRVARIFARELARAGASPRVQKALFAAGLVESGLRPLNYGDRDSLGPLQQRPSQGWGRPDQVIDPKYAARQFLKRAIPLNEGFRGSAGQLAQAVQRSAFPERYDQRGGDADALRRRFLRGYVDAPDGVEPPARTAGTLPPVDVSSLLGRLTDGAMQVQASAPPAPAFAARAVAPAGAQIPAVSTPPSRGPRIEDLLAQVSQASGQPAVPGMGGSSGGQAAPGRPSRGSGSRVRPGGGYAGTTGVAVGLARLSGLKTSSGKREQHLTASGNASDHSRRVPDANARDLIGTTREMQRGAARIARELGIPRFRYGQDYTVVREIGGQKFRIQLITSPHGSGPHVHVGVKRVR